MGEGKERLFDRMANSRHRLAMVGPAAGPHRRGSILILVMTILGVLFVTGIAFMATMNFDAEVIMAEKQLGKTTPSVGAVIEDVGLLVVEAMLPSPGEEMTGEPVGSTPVSFGEMPGVHNLFAPIEPYWTYVNENYFRWVTDIASLNRRPFQGATHLWDSSGLRTNSPNGMPWGDPDFLALYPDAEVIVPVDADGDGIVDSVQVELLDGDPDDPDRKWTLAIDRAHLDRLRKVVNSPSNPGGKVFLGLRIVAHGGMVDLNHSHESLIRSVLWYPIAEGSLPQQRYGFKPYDATLEEPMLRRRNLLPSRLLSSSRIQGIPLADPADDSMADDFAYPLRIFGGDFARRLFPLGETARDHRYSPFAPDEYDDLGMAVLWTARMDPLPLANTVPEESPYDWRHLVTTVSHDDLLRRETWVEEEVQPFPGERKIKRTDVLDLMIAANERHLDGYTELGGYTEPWNAGSRQSPVCLARHLANVAQLNDELDDLLPFEYAAYPHGEPHPHEDGAGNPNEDEEPDVYWDKYQRAIDVDQNGEDIDEGVVEGMLRDWCKCQGDPSCTLHPLKGKLRLSLPWLEDALNIQDASGDTLITRPQGIRLIQDVFTMMLLNSRRSEWGEWYKVDLNDDDDLTNDWVDADGDRIDHWVDGDGDGKVSLDERGPRVWKYAPAALTEISRTAASLTANLIDFADADNIPTKVELRSADFRPLRDKAGAPILDPNRNPITIFGMGTDSPEFQGVADYLAGLNIDPDPPLPTPEYVYGLEPQPFITEVVAAVTTGADTDDNGFPDDPLLYFEGVELFNPYDVTLDLADTYELRVRGVDIEIPDKTDIGPGQFVVLYTGAVNLLPAPPNKGVALIDLLDFNEKSTIYLVRTDLDDKVIVDEFDLDGGTVGKEGELLRSAQRVVQLGADWTAPIPIDYKVDLDAETDTPTLGWPNSRPDPGLPPVEVRFANAQMGWCTDGSVCTTAVPGDCADGSQCAFDIDVIGLRRSFPTTGSLLLLMRHANSESRAFTTYLNEQVSVQGYNPQGSLIVPGSGLSRWEIDNGRMPVFDVGHLHHLDPAIKDPTADVPDPGHPDPRFTHPYPANRSDPGEPGGLRNIPWGQLVFDYFTALPLSSPGPYADDGDGAIPRVDEDGLRVHGRININAAPWPVLAGLPIVPMELIPEPFRVSFSTALGNMGLLTDDDGNPIPEAEWASLGPNLAKAIVAYREAREVIGVADYDDPPQLGITPTFGRGWWKLQPTVRRGTGFMTAGELANVRHPDAQAGARFDARQVPLVANGGYVKAIAPLAALADWVTVRSQVFTIYGVLRGEGDETLEDEELDEVQQDKVKAADVNSRAIRFQETVDRLPLFVGKRVPKRIGKRTITKYTDFRND